MTLSEYRRVLHRAADDLRSLAKQAPEIADELRDVSQALYAEAWRNRRIIQPSARAPRRQSVITEAI
jgi:hypothetical protein